MKKAAVVGVVAFALALCLESAASAAPTATVVRITRTSTWRRPSPDPTGIAYHAATKRLIVVDSEVDETPQYAGVDVWLKRVNRRLPSGSWSTVHFSHEPTDVAVRGRKTVFFTDDRQHRIFSVHPGPDRKRGTRDDVVTAFSSSAFGARDAEGLTFAHTRRGTFLYVVNGKLSRVVRLSPGPDGRFDGVAPVGDDRITARFSTSALGLTNPKGITFNPRTKILYIVGHDQQMVLRTRMRGRLVDTIDISGSGIVHPSGVTLAPASNSRTRIDVYITDWGARHKNDGRIFEFSLS